MALMEGWAAGEEAQATISEKTKNISEEGCCCRRGCTGKIRIYFGPKEEPTSGEYTYQVQEPEPLRREKAGQDTRRKMSNPTEKSCFLWDEGDAS